jgi:hypothetical protein
VGKIARHEHCDSHCIHCDFAHAIDREDRARVGTAREIFVTRGDIGDARSR